MGKPRTDPLAEINFRCSNCGQKFIAPPGRTADAPEQDWHPWAYFADCPTCDGEAEQAQWEQALLKAHARATGPKSPEGKAATTANLAGHPTPDEARITRFNALKHGLAAKVATFFPARPGQYDQCTGCEYLASRDCLSFQACLKRSELFLRFHAAFESGDPAPMQELFANTHAGLHALMQDMIRTIIADGGTRLKTPEWYHDKDGGFHLAQYLDEESGEMVQLHKLEEHPLLKRLMDFVSKNRTTLEDMALTPKQQDDSAALNGHLEKEAGEKETALDYQRRQTEALEQLRGQIDRSRERLRRDPVLIDHQQADEDG